MKNFNIWNEQKKKLEKTAPDELLFHERDIWWCSLGHNIGDEEDGKNHNFERPVLIIKKFNRKIALVIPMTTRLKNNFYYYRLTHDGISFCVILSQLRLVSVKRFRRFVRKISPNQFLHIKNEIKKKILHL